MGRRAVWSSLLVALVVFGAILLWSRPKPAIRFVGVSPEGYRFIPRENYVRKPLLDFKAPGFGRIVYPRPVVVHPEHQIDNGQAGVLIYPSSGRVNFHSWIFDEGTTTFFRRPSFLMQRTSWPNFTHVPYVFGKAPKVARFLGRSGNEVQIDVPANGLPEPKIPEEIVHVGPWRVKLSSRPWIGPSFKLEFDLTLLDADASDRFFIEVSYGELEQGYFPNHLHVRPGRAQRFEPDRRGNRKMTLTVYETEKVPLLLRFTRTRKGKVTREKLEIKGGPLLRDYLYEDLTMYGSRFRPDPYVAIHTKERAVHGGYMEPDGTHLSDLSIGSLPDRTTFPAVGCRVVRKATATTSRLLPDFARYASTWRGWH